MDLSQERAILDGSTLLRRCPAAEVLPKYTMARDLLNGDIKMLPGALQLKLTDDGLSVYWKELLNEGGYEDSAVRTKPSQLIFAFMASVVRSPDWGWDVRHDPKTDHLIGFAHSLIFHKNIPFRDDKERKQYLHEVRALIISKSIPIIFPSGDHHHVN